MSQPVTSLAQGLRASVPEDRWASIEELARERAEVLARVLAERERSGLSWRKCVAAVDPDLDWSLFLRMRSRYAEREGPVWERLLDERTPPPAPASVPDDVRDGAIGLRMFNRSMGPGEVREMLVGRFGERGNISDASLKRIWVAAGVTYIRTGRGGAREEKPEPEEVVAYHGGAGLALIAAADAQLGASGSLARAVQQTGEQHADAQVLPDEDQRDARPAGMESRNDKGQFTKDYNADWRTDVTPGEMDERWTTDQAKRAHRDLSSLATLKMEHSTLANKLLCMAATFLLTERRGFDGLDGPAGEWLGVFGATAYMPATLDKALTELALLDVGEAMWGDHAGRWVKQSQQWSQGGPGWLQYVAYIDASIDPHWTKKFAKAGKVSRINRVMPCTSRVAVHSGPGVGLVVESHPGTVSLKKTLLNLLERLDRIVGEGEVGRISIIDAEMATTELLSTMFLKYERGFITVLKGAIARSIDVRVNEDNGDWQPFRVRDEVREVELLLTGNKVPTETKTLYLRGVEMRRKHSRHDKSTVFITNMNQEALTTTDVADAYLSRWPYQEGQFRNGRNGGGLDRTHGYGGEYVTNVALETKVEKAQRSVAWAKAALTKAEAKRAEVVAAIESEPEASGALQTALPALRRDVAKAASYLAKAEQRAIKQGTMPQQIWVRDTTKDGITTCLKLHLLTLIEYVLQEYFGGTKMEVRTFIEQFVHLPVTVRTTATAVRYQIHANPRQPQRTAQLRAACDTINDRGIVRAARKLTFEVLGLERGS